MALSYSFKLRGQTFTAATLSELSALYCAARDESGEGQSTFPSVNFSLGRNLAGRISYNGKIWDKTVKQRDSGSVLYDPYLVRIIVRAHQNFRGVWHFEEAKYDVSTELAKEAVASGVARLA